MVVCRDARRIPVWLMHVDVDDMRINNLSERWATIGGNGNI